MFFAWLYRLLALPFGVALLWYGYNWYLYLESDAAGYATHTYVKSPLVIVVHVVCLLLFVYFGGKGRAHSDSASIRRDLKAQRKAAEKP